MNRELLTRHSDFEWWIEPTGQMRVPAVIYAGEPLIEDMDEKVREQLSNVATLPGFQRAAYAMPDAHWGYGFPIGGVAAFDPRQGGVISGGGVGFDISCGVRALCTGLTADQIEPQKPALAEALFRSVPAGVGSTGGIRLTEVEMDEMLYGGARWAVARGYGSPEDLERIEEGGFVSDASPEFVSHAAKNRQAEQMGTLGNAGERDPDSHPIASGRGGGSAGSLQGCQCRGPSRRACQIGGAGSASYPPDLHKRLMFTQCSRELQEFGRSTKEPVS